MRVKNVEKYLAFFKTNSKTSNNQRLRSASNNDRRSKPLSALVKTHLLQRCASRKFYVTDVKTRVIKVRSVDSIHSQWKSKRMLATYMRRMRNNNLEIRIAGFSFRPQWIYRVARPTIPLNFSFQGICRITFSLSQSQSQSFGGTSKRGSPTHDPYLKFKIRIYNTYNKNISVKSSIILQFSHTNFAWWFCHIFNPYTSSVTF